MADDHGVWVYAIAGELAEQWFSGTAGVGGQPVYPLAADGLAAAVSPVSLAEFGEEALRRNLEDLSWVETVAMAHHAVIEAAAAHVPVLPLRLATVYRSEDRVRADLRQRGPEFAAALRRITGRAEWGIKVYTTQVGAAGTAGAAEPADAPAGPGAAYLRRRREQLAASQASRRAAAEAADDIHAALAGEVTAALLRRPQAPQLSPGAEGMILNAAYLVDHSHAAGFRRRAEDMARRYPEVRVELTGPWPAYSFATTGPPPVAGPPRAAGAPSAAGSAPETGRP